LDTILDFTTRLRIFIKNIRQILVEIVLIIALCSFINLKLNIMHDFFEPKDNSNSVYILVENNTALKYIRQCYYPEVENQ